MRLRRETGDFQIVLGETGYTARPNLKAEQFVGEIVVDTTGVYHVVTEVTPTQTGCTLTAGTLTLAYVAETGAITVVTD